MITNAKLFVRSPYDTASKVLYRECSKSFDFTLLFSLCYYWKRSTLLFVRTNPKFQAETVPPQDEAEKKSREKAEIDAVVYVNNLIIRVREIEATLDDEVHI